MNIGDINWREDAWFATHHANAVTDDFKRWWLEYYGAPSQYEGERDEYWVRCAFAWLGWKAATNKES